MDYISELPIHCSKANLKCVFKCTKFPENKVNGYMSKTNLVPVLTTNFRLKQIK